MSEYSTGPIENSMAGGVRTSTALVVRLLNTHPAATAGVLIQGYVLGTTNTLYVSENILLGPNETQVRTYYAGLDGLEYRFTVEEELQGQVHIFVGGIKANGELNAAHRISVGELKQTAQESIT